MNLEDRLRSHLHSGDDLFVEGLRSAADISALGARRTRRNQVGGAVAGGVLALGLVAGAVSFAGGGSDDVEFAADGASMDESAAIESVEERLEGALAADGEFGADMAVEESAGLDESFAAADEDADQSSIESELFEGAVPPFETVVGVDDGFAGLRDTDGTITAITSDDGGRWDERPTSGIVEGSTFVEITYEEGWFAAVFTRFVDPGQETWIGTSPDLQNWTLVPVAGDGLEVFVSSIELRDGEVLAIGVTFDLPSETETTFESASRLYRGPAGGPYEVESLPVDNPVGIFSAQGALFVGDNGRLLRSVDGGSSWQVVDEASADDFGAYYGSGELVLSLDRDGAIRESLDAGDTWALADLPVATDPNSSIFFVEGADTVAIFATAFDAGGEAPSIAMVRDSSGWTAIDGTDRIPAGVFASPIALSSEELIVQIFRDSLGPPTLPEYIRIPLS